MVAASDQKYLAPIPTAGIVVISIYVAAQLLSDIASLKITLIAGFSMGRHFHLSSDIYHPGPDPQAPREDRRSNRDYSGGGP